MNEVFGKVPVKGIVGGLAALFAVYAATDCFYKVEPNEVANIRRLDKVLYSTPIKSGTHFKLPFIDQVDKAQLSLRTLKIPTFSVNTVDNQKIDLEINFNYKLPISNVNHLLYEVGQVESAENDDIDDSIIPVAMDRAGRVFAKQNTTNISMDRENIQAEVTAEVFKAVRELFGIEPQSLQIAKIGYSDSFVRSNDIAVSTKNAAVAEENKKDVVTAVAQQFVIEATGKADAKIKAASGQAESIRLRAAAEKESLTLEAQGLADRLRAEIKPFGTPDAYIKYLEKQAALKWDGQRPQVEVQGADTANDTKKAPAATVGKQNTIVVPIPAAPK